MEEVICVLFQGDVCANPCPEGTWGYNCSELCDCYNSGQCDHMTGRCKCPSGYIGNKVYKSPAYSTFGLSLQCVLKGFETVQLEGEEEATITL